jgi:hypothetical protein
LNASELDARESSGVISVHSGGYMFPRLTREMVGELFERFRISGASSDERP